MKNAYIFTIAFAFLGLMTLAQENQSADIWNGDNSGAPNVELKAGESLQTTNGSGLLLYDNGPFINSPGTGAGGADESVLQSTSLSMNLLGFGHQISAGNWIADDFTVPSGGWDITAFAFYAYQTGSTTTSTMNAVHIIIYDGVPGDPGTSIVWGDASTDRMTSTGWTNVYRVTETTSGSTNRPIMENTCEVDIHLDAGTYWVAWQAGGTLASGPWAHPITINGQTVTGNALQSVDDQLSWGDALDSGTSTQQGFPFKIYADAGEVPLSDYAVYLGIFLILAFTAIRFRRVFV